MDSQSIIVFTVIVLAAVYIGRRLWLSPKARSGCSMCPRNPRRVDDYA